MNTNLCTGLLLTALCGCLAGCASPQVVRLYEGTLPPGNVAVLTVPPLVDVLAVDGTGVTARRYGPLSRDQELHLSPGAHVVTARYSAVYDIDHDDHHVVYSEPVQLRFQAEEGGAYRLVCEEGRPIPGTDRIEAEFRVVANTSRAAATNGSSPESRAPPVRHPSPPAEAPRDSGQRDLAEPAVAALDLLKVWWLRASREERQAFLDWVEPER
jgi:uncharacterized protein YccT (UPF0319 family)